MTKTLTQLTFGDHVLNCHASFTKGRPAQVSGPPEHCYPEEPSEFELESVFLEVEVTEDLGLNAGKRKVEVDITEMLEGLDILDRVARSAERKFYDSEEASDANQEPFDE